MNLRRALLIALPYSWLLIFFLVPFGIVLKISLSDIALAIPMFQIVYPRVKSALITDAKYGIFDSAAVALIALAVAVVNIALLVAVLSVLFPALANFVEIPDFLYFAAYLSSLKIAVISTFLTLLIGYPIVMLIILPFWTSFLIRVYAWMGILSTEGYLNQVLLNIGVISEPLVILNTNIAVYIGIVYTYLPFMVLPIYAALDRMDDSLVEAAEDLGCTSLSAFWLVTAPLSKPGVIAGCFLVFIPTLGEFVIPSLLGGSNTLMIGKVLWEEFFSNRDWPVASAVAVILLLILIIPIVLFQRNQEGGEP